MRLKRLVRKMSNYPLNNYVPGPGPSREVVQLDPQRMAETVFQPMSYGEIDGSALRGLETVSEKSTPMNRALATSVKSGVALVGTAIIAWAMTKAGVDSSIGWALFCLMLLTALTWLSRSDNIFSPLGVERHKATEYRKIRVEELRSSERVQVAKINAYMTILDRVHPKVAGRIAGGEDE